MRYRDLDGQFSGSLPLTIPNFTTPNAQLWSWELGGYL